jgi:hypothetical protein
MYINRLGRSGALTDHSSVLFDVGVYIGKNEKGEAIKGNIYMYIRKFIIYRLICIYVYIYDINIRVYLLYIDYIE